MYFEDISYVDQDVWVTVDLPRPVTSNDLYEGDVMKQSLGGIFGQPALPEDYLKVSKLINAPPPPIQKDAYTPDIDALDELTKNAGTIEKGTFIFGVTGKERIQITGDGSQGTFGIYDEENRLSGAVGKAGAGTFQLWKEGQYAGSVYPTGTSGEQFEQQTHSTQSAWQDLGISGCRHIAQQFTASSNYILTRARLRIGQHLWRTPAVAYIRIYGDSGNSPSGMLGEQAIWVGSSYPQYYDANFNISLTNGTKYWIALITSTTQNGYPMRLYGANTDAYPSHYCKGYSGGWYTMANTDVWALLYEATTSLSIGVDNDFDLGGNMLRSHYNKLHIPLFLGGGKEVLTGSSADWMNKSWGDVADHLLTGPYYWWSPADWKGQTVHLYCTAWFKSNLGYNVHLYLWNDVGGAKLAQFNTTNQNWAGYTSGLMSMPGSSCGVALGCKTSNTTETVQIQSVYLEAYIGDV
jgi:hypothetical protein